MKIVLKVFAYRLLLDTVNLDLKTRISIKGKDDIQLISLRPKTLINCLADRFGKKKITHVLKPFVRNTNLFLDRFVCLFMLDEKKLRTSSKSF